MIYFFLFIISFVIFGVGTIMSAEKKNKVKGTILQIVGGVLLMFSTMVGCDKCLSPSPNASKDFNEWTGEPRNKTPFGY